MQNFPVQKAPISGKNLIIPPATDIVRWDDEWHDAYSFTNACQTRWTGQVNKDFLF